MFFPEQVLQVAAIDGLLCFVHAYIENVFQYPFGKLDKPCCDRGKHLVKKIGDICHSYEQLTASRPEVRTRDKFGEYQHDKCDKGDLCQYPGGSGTYMQ